MRTLCESINKLDDFIQENKTVDGFPEATGLIKVACFALLDARQKIRDDREKYKPEVRKDLLTRVSGLRKAAEPYNVIKWKWGLERSQIHAEFEGHPSIKQMNDIWMNFCVEQIQKSTNDTPIERSPFICFLYNGRIPRSETRTTKRVIRVPGDEWHPDIENHMEFLVGPTTPYRWFETEILPKLKAAQNS